MLRGPPEILGCVLRGLWKNDEVTGDGRGGGAEFFP